MTTKDTVTWAKERAKVNSIRLMVVYSVCPKCGKVLQNGDFITHLQSCEVVKL